MSEEFVSVRCPGELVHTINGKEFPTCNKLIGAMPENGDFEAIFKCPTCGFYHVTRINGITHYKSIYGKINLKSSWRIIDGN